MRSKCRLSSTLLKNGNAAEKIKTRAAAAKQRSKMRMRSFLLTNVFDSPEVFIKMLRAPEQPDFPCILRTDSFVIVPDKPRDIVPSFVCRNFVPGINYRR